MRLLHDLLGRRHQQHAGNEGERRQLIRLGLAPEGEIREDCTGEHRNDERGREKDAFSPRYTSIAAGGDRCEADRKSVVEGKSVSVRIELGGSRIIKKKTKTNQKKHNRQTQ